MDSMTSIEIIKQYRPLKKGEFFCVGVDTAAGGIDNCVAQFISKQNNDIPLVYCENITATEMTPKIKTILEKVYDKTGVKPCVAFERNNGGVFEMERLSRLNKFDKYTMFEMPEYGNKDSEEREPYKIGWETNAATRPKMLSDLKEAIDNHFLKIYDKKTIEELFSFVIVQTRSRWKATADVGKHDDLVMAAAIAYQLYLTQEPSSNVSLSDLPSENYFDSEGFY